MLEERSGASHLTQARRWASEHQLTVYVVLAYALSWAYWWPLVLAGKIVRTGSPVTQFPALLGPALAAFAVTAVTSGRPGVRDLAGRMLRWRVPGRWWLFAVGSPLALLAGAVLLNLILHQETDLAAFGRM